MSQLNNIGYISTNLSLTEKTKALARELSEYYGVNFSSLIRMLLLEEARELGLIVNKESD
jgi:antitoxin component of RelBE/YafQ-DinJ toxin-antitoxin module